MADFIKVYIVRKQDKVTHFRALNLNKAPEANEEYVFAIDETILKCKILKVKNYPKFVICYVSLKDD